MALTVMEMVAKLGLDDSEFQKGASGVGKSAKTMGDHVKRGAFIAATAITGGLVVAAKVGWDAFQEGQVIALQTETVLKSTGNVAHTSAGQIQDLATSLQNKSGIDDHVIRSGENLLLTFQNVRNEAGKGNDIFVQGTKAALDYSAATGKDMSSSVRAVGRALNDPIKGLSMLTKQGISFTDQEKKQIAHMVKHNNLIGAQKLILDKLNTTYGGSADISSTVAGKMAIAKQQFKDTAETLVGALLPAFIAILGPIASVAKYLGEHSTTAKILVGVLGGLAAVLFAVSAAETLWAAATTIASVATAGWTAVQWLLNAALTANPIGLVVLALVALAVGLVIAWKKSETFRGIVTGAFHAIQAVVGAVVGFIRDHWMLLMTILGGPIGAIAAQIIKHWGAIKDGAIRAWHAVRDVVSTVVDAIRDKVSAGKDKIVAIFDAIKAAGARLGDTFDPFISAIRTAIGWVRSIIAWIANIPRSITIGVNLPDLPGGGGLLSRLRQHGGPVQAGQAYIVGEKRAEVFVPRTSGTILPSVGMAGGGGGGTMVFNFPNYVGSHSELESWIQKVMVRYEQRNGRRFGSA